MKIVIDLQGAQSESRYRGIGRYSMALALNAARAKREHDIHLLLNGAFEETVGTIREAFLEVLPPENIHVFHVPLPVKGMHVENLDRIVAAEVVRDAAIAALKPDLVHVSSLFEGYGDDSVTGVVELFDIPTVVTLYDLIPLMNRQVYLDPVPPYKIYYERKLARLKKADALLAISNCAMEEAQSGLSLEQGRLFNISAACDPVFTQLSQTSPVKKLVQHKFGLDIDFILYTGGSDERKNLRSLVDAYARLEWRQRMRCRLVLAGRMHQPHVDELRARAAAAGLEPQEIVFTGYISDIHLAALYNLCRLFVFPSWHEGFGLPVLEAMSCGAGVIASDASSIREIVQFKPALFDPADVESIRERMSHYLDHDEDLAALREYSIERARAFSWAKVADRFLDACEEVASRRTAPALPDGDALIDFAADALVVPRPADIGVEMALADALDRSVPPKLPKIMVDVTELSAHDLKTGIQRVTRAIIAEWGARPPPGYCMQLVRLDRERRRYVCADRYASEFFGGRSVHEDGALVCHAGDIFLGLDLVGDSVALVPDWFNYFRSTGVRIAFTVYDILPVRHPEWWPGDGHRHHERWLRGIAAHADLLICISRATADDVESWMESQGTERPPALAWFHLGANIEGSVPTAGLDPQAESILGQLGAGTSFLMVGTLEPRKGHTQALAAFEYLWSEGRDVLLVIVGKRGWLVDELADRLSQHPELGKRLFWLAGISDEFLERLYGACDCLLAASEGEGFGLPLIEAAQRGLPLLARDIPVFREVAGDSAFYFEGSDVSSLAAAVQSWMQMYSRGSHPRAGGVRWLTWSQSSDQLVEVLRGDLRSAGDGTQRHSSALSSAPGGTAQ